MADQYIGEIRLFANAFAPDGWFPCDGRLYSINQYQALYSVIGNRFGGAMNNNTFGIPNLIGLAVAGPGLSLPAFAQTYGTPTVTLTVAQLPTHTHQMVRAGGSWTYAKKTSVPAPGSELGGLLVNASAQGSAPTLMTAGLPDETLAPETIGAYGGLAHKAHDNQQPTLTCIFAIAHDGDYPVPAN